MQMYWYCAFQLMINNFFPAMLPDVHLHYRMYGIILLKHQLLLREIFSALE